MAAASTLFSVAGKLCLVTGASSGLGLHFARTLAKHGAKVAVAARRVDRLDALVQELRQSGVTGVCAVRMDVCDEMSIKSGVKQVEETLGPIDVLVNNAGVAIQQLALRQSKEDWDKHRGLEAGVPDVKTLAGNPHRRSEGKAYWAPCFLDKRKVLGTNLLGPFLVAQVVARSMVRDKRPGCIINISSAASIGPVTGLSSYCASKAGLTHLTKVLALEWARHGIRVNAMCPGYFRSEMNNDFFDTPNGERLVKAIPMRRYGDLRELEGLLILLASDSASSYMTGSIISLDGGLLLSNL